MDQTQDIIDLKKLYIMANIIMEINIMELNIINMEIYLKENSRIIKNIKVKNIIDMGN